MTIREKDVYNYPSWCYGYVSISNSINRICNTTHVEFNGHLTIDMNKQMNELRQIIEEKDISLCHGIAGEILFCL
ncbi:lanthionine synthetase LanC family protein [Streptococcus intermedius]|uniref:lanthionine synthetase LanC family protein n=1 Tax=Streptococcus intermedius TaxID=1338 RepID=UPI0012FD10BB